MASLVPIMTDYTTPAGVASASSEYNTYGYAAWRAFDGTEDWGWGTPYNVYSGWIAYEWGGQVSHVVGYYEISAMPREAMWAPKTWTFEGYDGENWVVLDTQTDAPPWDDDETRSFPIANETAYFAYRLNVTDTEDHTYLTVGELGLFVSVSPTIHPATLSLSATIHHPRWARAGKLVTVRPPVLSLELDLLDAVAGPTASSPTVLPEPLRLTAELIRPFVVGSGPPRGESWYFDKTAERYVTMDDHAALTLPNTEWALGGWFKLDDNNAGTLFRYLISWGVVGANPSWNVYIGEASHSSSDYRNRIIIANGSSTYVSTYSITAGGRALGDWHHLLMTRQGGGSGTLFTVYLDGVFIYGGSYITSARDVAAPWHWGIRQDLNAERRFRGHLSEWAKWNRGLTVAEREWLAIGVRPSAFPASLAWYVPMNRLWAENIVPLTLTRYNAVSSPLGPTLIPYEPVSVAEGNLIPAMTKNPGSQPYSCAALRETDSISLDDPHVAWRAFDGDVGSWWGGLHIPPLSAYNRYPYPTYDNEPTWISFSFGTNNHHAVNRYRVRARILDTSGAPKDWTLQAWTGTDAAWDGWGGTAWTTLHTVTGQVNWGPGEERQFNFLNTKAYRAYRLVVTANNGKTGYLSNIGTGYLTEIAKIGFYYSGEQPTPSSRQPTAGYTMTYFNENGTVWGVPLGDKVAVGPTAGKLKPHIRHPQYDQRITWPSHPFNSDWTVQVTNSVFNGTYRVGELTSRHCIHLHRAQVGYDYPATGNERIVRYISTQSGAGHMAADSKGNLYVGTGWDTTTGTMVIKIDARTGAKVYDFLDWPAGLSSTYIVRGICLSADERYLYVLAAPNGSGYIWKFDLTTGSRLWGTRLSSMGYDLAIDAQGNAYARAGGFYVNDVHVDQDTTAYPLRKFRSSDGLGSTLSSTVGQRYQPPGTNIIGSLVYGIAVDNDLGIVIGGGQMSCLNSHAALASPYMYCLGVRTFDDSAGATWQGWLTTGASLTETAKIITKNILTRGGYIYVTFNHGSSPCSIYKLQWTGSAIVEIKRINGPTHGINSYFDVYGNLVVIRANQLSLTDTSFHYYDADLNSYDVSLGQYYDGVCGSWADYAWLRGTVCPNGVLTDTLPGGGGILGPDLEGEAQYGVRLVGFVTPEKAYILCLGGYRMAVYTGGTTPSIVMDGEAAYSLETPWSAAEVWDLVFAPGGQAIFHPDHDIYELICNGDTDWKLTPFQSGYGPFLEPNKDQTLTIKPDKTTGEIELKASKELFHAKHVGALWELTQDVDEISLTGIFRNVPEPPYVEEETSATVILKGKWEVTIAWHGLGLLKLQRSEDGEVWKTVKSWAKPMDVPVYSIADAGEELEDNVAYRFYLNWFGIEQPGEPFQWLIWRLNPPYCQYSLKAKATTQTGIVRITAVDPDGMKAEATVLNALGTTEATSDWREGAWSDYRGWPAKGMIHESRIYAARTEHQPTTVWAGRPFLRREDPRLFYAGTDVTDDDAFARTLDNPDCHTIEWLASLWVMLVASDGNLVKCIGATENSPMTPTQFNAMPQSGMGSAFLQPVMVSGHALYTGRSGKRIYEMTYSDDARVYAPEDLTRYAEHVTGPGIVGWAFMQQPYPILWAVTGAGELIGLTRDKNENLLAWHRHTTDGRFESVAVIPSDGDDEVWAVVARAVGGVTKRYVERMAPFDWGADQADCFFVDSGYKWDGGAAVAIGGLAIETGQVTVTATGHGFSDGCCVRFAGVGGTIEVNGRVYMVADSDDDTFILTTRDGLPYIDGSEFTPYTEGGTVTRVTNTLAGLTHLASETVSVLLDGQPATGAVDADGGYTSGELDRHFANTIIIGRDYNYTLEPMPFEIRGIPGTVHGVKKRITKCGVRLYRSAGGKIGSTMADALALDYREPGHVVGAPVELVTKDLVQDYPGGWNEEGSIVVTGEGPLPMNVTAILYSAE